MWNIAFGNKEGQMLKGYTGHFASELSKAIVDFTYWSGNTAETRNQHMTKEAH